MIYHLVRTASSVLLALACLVPFSTYADLPDLRLKQEIRGEFDDLFPDPQSAPQSPGFGLAVAIRGDLALVGMPLREPLGRVGIYQRDASGVWNRTGTLNGQGTEFDFGRSLAMRDNIAVVGTTRSVVIFRRTTAGQWIKTATLVPETEEPIQHMSQTIRYQDGMVVVGAELRDAPDAVFVFEITAAGKYVRQHKLVASDGQDRDGFGWSVSMTHNTIVVGAPGRNFVGGSTGQPGAAYVFRKTASGWVERQKLIASDGAPHDFFGHAVAVDNSMIVVGAPNAKPVNAEVPDPDEPTAQGEAYTFLPEAGVWSERAQLRPRPDQVHAYWRFGDFIAMFGDRIVITAAERSAPHDFGFAFAYSRNAAQVTLIGEVNPGTRNTPDITALSMTGGIAMLGSGFMLDSGFFADYVWMYDLRNPIP